MWLVIIDGFLFKVGDIMFKGLGEMMFNLFLFMVFFGFIESIRILRFFIGFMVLDKEFLFVLEFLFVIIIKIFLVLGCFLVLLKILKVFCNVFLRYGFLFMVGWVLMVVFRLFVLGGKVWLKLINFMIKFL